MLHPTHGWFVRRVGDHKSYAAIFVPRDARRAILSDTKHCFPQPLRPPPVAEVNGRLYSRNMEASGRTENESFDVLVVGAGPTGLACAIEVQRAGFTVVCVDKGCLCNSLFHYPSNMTFFTTPELLEIGDMPFSSPNQKPNRNEALEYYRKVTEHYQLNLRQYQTVGSITGEDGNFSIAAIDNLGRRRTYTARKVILATGYYDLPNYLHVPGEELAKVLHYYHDPHPYYDQEVVVVGGKNSAAIAALDLWRHGAHVTLVHRGAAMHHHVKYWILPDINNRIKKWRGQGIFLKRCHKNCRRLG